MLRVAAKFAGVNGEMENVHFARFGGIERGMQTLLEKFKVGFVAACIFAAAHRGKIGLVILAFRQKDDRAMGVVPGEEVEVCAVGAACGTPRVHTYKVERRFLSHAILPVTVHAQPGTFGGFVQIRVEIPSAPKADFLHAGGLFNEFNFLAHHIAPCLHGEGLAVFAEVRIFMEVQPDLMSAGCEVGEDGITRFDRHRGERRLSLNGHTPAMRFDDLRHSANILHLLIEKNGVVVIALARFVSLSGFTHRFDVHSDGEQQDGFARF